MFSWAVQTIGSCGIAYKEENFSRPIPPCQVIKTWNTWKTNATTLLRSIQNPYKERFRLIWAVYGDLWPNDMNRHFLRSKKLSLSQNASLLDNRKRYIEPYPVNHECFLFVSWIWIEWAMSRLTNPDLKKVMSKKRKSMSKSDPSRWVTLGLSVPPWTPFDFLFYFFNL